MQVWLRSGTGREGSAPWREYVLGCLGESSHTHEYHSFCLMPKPLPDSIGGMLLRKSFSNDALVKGMMMTQVASAPAAK